MNDKADVLGIVKDLKEAEKSIVPIWFDTWYQDFTDNWGDNYYAKSDAIRKINQVGYGKGFLDYRGIRLGDYQQEIFENKEFYTRAILDGYVVEIPKFYVMSKDKYFMLRKNEEGKVVECLHSKKWINYLELEDHQLIVEEVKSYDKRYLDFVVPISEVD